MNQHSDQQLLAVSLDKIMGAHAKDPEFPEKIVDFALLVWSDLLENEIIDLLNQEQKEVFVGFLSDEKTTQEELLDFFKQAVPDFDERHERRMLPHKALAVTGRIELLRATVDPEEKELFAILDHCDELAKQQEWLKLQDVLVEHFSEY